MTSPIEVDPEALKGYSKQLARNAELFPKIDIYCERHCADTSGLTGLTWAQAIPAVKAFAHIQEDLVLAAREHLYTTADQLELAAIRYATGDQASAERIWTTQPRWTVPPAQWVDNTPKHVGDFSDPSDVNPPVPKHNNDMQKKIDGTLATTKEIDRWLRKYFHFSLHEEVFPWLTGDWGKVRQLADGYAALAGDAGWQAIDTNIQHGMDSLASTWNGPAAHAFEFHISARWHKALDGAAQICTASKEGLEHLAQQAESLYVLLEAALTTLLIWLIDKAAKALQWAMRGFGLLKGAQIVKEIWHQIEKFVHWLELVWKIIPAAVKSLIQLAEALYALAKADMALVGGDLAAIRSG